MNKIKSLAVKGKNAMCAFWKDESGMPTLETVLLIILAVSVAGLVIYLVTGTMTEKIEEADEVIGDIDFGGGGGTGGGTGTGAGTGTGTGTGGR